MRYRKNINCLSSNELHDLREAFTGIYQLPSGNPQSFETIAGLHGNPPPSYCIHNLNGFLTWHRAYLLELENALRCIRCNVTLPYWNWSSGPTTGVPAACSSPTYVHRNGLTVANPLYAGPKPASSGGGHTNRRANIDTTTFDDLAINAQNALSQANFGAFVAQLDGAHGGVHVRIGGDMGSVPSAGFDPIFYLHHANVDRIWSIWQNAHPIPLPTSEANVNLIPFTRPYSNAWHQGRDFEFTTDWDYQYRNWCFIFPDDIFWPDHPVLKFPIGDWLFKSQNIELTFSAEMMPRDSFELMVFVNNPKANLRSKIKENINFAGTFGAFGMGNAKVLEGTKNPFRKGLDITNALRKCVKKNDKEVSIKLVPRFLDNKVLHKMKMPYKMKIGLEVY